MRDNYQIIAFNSTKFFEIFSKFSNLDNRLIHNNIHFKYLYDYLEHIHCKSIVLEEEYIDLDYLDDYVEYFAKCFRKYDKFCKRLHFFSTELEEQTYYEIITNKLSESINLQEYYLGFVVIRPLPKTLIGRTCLATYEDLNSRNYCIRDYHIHLHGIKYQVKSLAYQEQDGVVSACATTALWSAFHGSGHIFNHKIPTPIQITKRAIENMPMIDRGIPSNGLSIHTIIKAINYIGLEAEVYNASNNLYLLKSIIYAYSKFGIPIVLGGPLFNRKTKEYYNNNNYNQSLHAVTICGFNFNDIDIMKNKTDEPNFISSKIDKVYIHDDQIGPFSSCRIKDERLMRLNNQCDELLANYYLETSWTDHNNEMGDIIFIPEFLIIPVYHKIRIRLDAILTLLQFDFNILKNSIEDKNLLKQIEYEVLLMETSNLKEIIRENNSYDFDKKFNLITKNFPKYIWVVKILYNSVTLSMKIYDTTGIIHDDLELHIIE
jgi:hypothetical protein